MSQKILGGTPHKRYPDPSVSNLPNEYGLYPWSAFRATVADINPDTGNVEPEGGGTLPIILWEPDLTQKIVDDGYIVDVLGDGTAVFDVVGLWASEGYSPLGPGIGARSFGAPPAITPTSPLSYISPAMAEAAAAYAARVKNR